MPANKTAKKKPSRKKSDLSDDIMLGLYEYLLRTRMVDERFRKLYRQGRFAGTYYSAVGQEATTVGPTYGLRDEDIIAPSHRELGAAITKGIPMVEIFAHNFARRNSPDKGKTHPCHYSSREKGVIVAASTLAGQTVIGTGCAMGFKIKRQDNVVLSFFGEGATSRGGWHEALNYAGVHKLPIVYICQNNLWAESVPASMQAGISNFSDRAKAYGFPGITIDGNDIFNVHKISVEAIEKARNGEGPTLIECKTYRYYGHSEIDPANYRNDDEIDRWKRKDPLPKAEKVLMDSGLITTQQREAMVDMINTEIEEAIEICEKEEYCEPEEAYNDVYSDSFPVRREEF